MRADLAFSLHELRGTLVPRLAGRIALGRQCLNRSPRFGQLRCQPITILRRGITGLGQRLNILMRGIKLAGQLFADVRHRIAIPGQRRNRLLKR